MSKRKRVEHVRLFLDLWTNDYLFIEQKGKPLCLVCRQTVALSKAYNAKRHYESFHKEKYVTINGTMREDLVKNLKNSLSAEQNVFKKPVQQTENAVTAFFIVAEEIARSSRPFTDEEFVRSCINKVTKLLVPDQAHLFEKISLSRATISRRIQKIDQNISDKLSLKAKSFVCFSVAFDESSDIKDTAQLAVFNLGVSFELSVHEDLLGLVSFRNCTRGIDTKEAVVRLLLEKIPNESLNKLCGLTTDGCPSMTGEENGVVVLLKKDAQQSFPHRDILNVHCIIHQESLCAKTLKMDHVMDVVIKCVNKIGTKALKHRQFQSFLEEVGAEYGDLIYHCDVCWLNRGKVLERFQNLLEEFRVKNN